jgi:hypothetical protein
MNANATLICESVVCGHLNRLHRWGAALMNCRMGTIRLIPMRRCSVGRIIRSSARVIEHLDCAALFWTAPPYLDCAAYSALNDCRMRGGAFAYLE